ncbi:hypothetical protein SCUP234_13147 [Seiridium cupressi]
MLEKYPHTPIGSDKYRTSISSSWKSKDYMMAPFKPGAGVIQVGLKQLESREQGTVEVSDIGAYAVFYQNTNTQDSEHLIRRNNELKITSDRYRPSVARIGQPARPSMNVTGLPTHNENLMANDEDLIKKSKNPQGWKKWIEGAEEDSPLQRNNVIDHYLYTYTQQKPSFNHTTIIMPTAFNRETPMDRPTTFKTHPTLGHSQAAQVSFPGKVLDRDLSYPQDYLSADDYVV